MTRVMTESRRACAVAEVVAIMIEQPPRKQNVHMRVRSVSRPLLMSWMIL